MPAENLVGELNAGWSVLQTALAYERRFMADIARTAKDAKRPRDEKGHLLIDLARDAGRLDDPYIRQRRVGHADGIGEDRDVTDPA